MPYKMTYFLRYDYTWLSFFGSVQYYVTLDMLLNGVIILLTEAKTPPDLT